MDSGEKTYADILTLFPFDNRLVLCSVKGSKLLSQFIQTSNSNYHIALSEYGKSIIGKIDPNGTYYLITDSYSSTYAPNGLTEVAEYDSGVFARDLLANALKNDWRGYEDLRLRIQKDPEKYKNLQIRLCGWNVYFTELDRAAQDHLIESIDKSDE